MSDSIPISPNLDKLFGKRRWPAVEQPVEAIQSLQRSVEALKTRSHIQSREVGSVLDSFVTVRDLVDLGFILPNGAVVVGALQDQIDALAIRVADLEAGP